MHKHEYKCVKCGMSYYSFWEIKETETCLFCQAKLNKVSKDASLHEFICV